MDKEEEEEEEEEGQGNTHSVGVPQHVHLIIVNSEELLVLLLVPLTTEATSTFSFLPLPGQQNFHGVPVISLLATQIPLGKFVTLRMFALHYARGRGIPRVATTLRMSVAEE